jgi:hypothetical protein
MVAVELAIVPESMRAGRISLYDWDPVPDPAKHPTDITDTTMTNGLNTTPRARLATNAESARLLHNSDLSIPLGDGV